MIYVGLQTVLIDDLACSSAIMGNKNIVTPDNNIYSQVYRARTMEKFLSLEDFTLKNKTIEDYVKGIPFFADLSQEEFKLVVQRFGVYKAAAGETVFSEGDQSSHLCLVAEGSISIFKHISDAEQLQVAEIKAGGSIGEMGILDGQPVSATAVASVNSIVFLISRTEFKRLVFEQKDIGVKFLWKIGRIISVRLRKTTGLLSDISISNSDIGEGGN